MPDAGVVFSRSLRRRLAAVDMTPEERREVTTGSLVDRAEEARGGERSALVREGADGIVQAAVSVGDPTDLVIEPVHHERGAVVEGRRYPGACEVAPPAAVALEEGEAADTEGRASSTRRAPRSPSARRPTGGTAARRGRARAGSCTSCRATGSECDHARRRSPRPRARRATSDRVRSRSAGAAAAHRGSRRGAESSCRRAGRAPAHRAANPARPRPSPPARRSCGDSGRCDRGATTPAAGRTACRAPRPDRCRRGGRRGRWRCASRAGGGTAAGRVLLPRQFET